jgi:hypothetical protein
MQKATISTYTVVKNSNHTTGNQLMQRIGVLGVVLQKEKNLCLPNVPNSKKLDGIKFREEYIFLLGKQP